MSCLESTSSQEDTQVGKSRRARVRAQQSHFPVRRALGQLGRLTGPNFTESSSPTHCSETQFGVLSEKPDGTELEAF